jgi:ribonuclease BN (tRNA processing enzyme)
MKIVFLGVGEAFDENYPNNAHLIISDQTTILLDCGDSAVRQLWKYTSDHNLIDCLFITHRHSDHLFGIPALLGRMLEEKRTKDLTIICSEKIKEDIERISEHAYQGLKSNFGFNINFIIAEEEKSIQFNELTLSFALSNHTSHNLAVKINNGKNIVCYSGDGIINEQSWDLYQDANLLIHEAYTYDKEIRGHVKIKDLITAAEKYNVKCLALTHFKRDFIKNELEKYLPVILKNDNLQIIIPKPMDEYEIN